MILADTSIWIDHLRKGDAKLFGRLSAGTITCHAFVVAEIALGSLKNRNEVLGLLDRLPGLPMANVSEVRVLIKDRRFFSRGIGYVDASLLASCLLEPGTTLWTRDRRLAALADEIGITAPDLQN